MLAKSSQQILGRSLWQRTTQMSFLGMIPQRGFASIKSAVYDNAIFMPDMFPSKLTVPYSSTENFEFTMHRNESIAEFKEKVLQACPEEIKSFDLLPVQPKEGEEGAGESMAVGELKTRKFKMKVNSKTYDVYPDLRSLIYKS